MVRFAAGAPSAISSIAGRAIHFWHGTDCDQESARYEFTAARDENGVPHVEAPTWHEALYAWGYMHAIDRPTQVYFARAVASGQATERIANKPELLEMDIFLRRAGLYRDLGREVPPPAGRAPASSSIGTARA